MKRLLVVDDDSDIRLQLQAILEAYRDFRGALKQAEVMALEVLKKAEWKLDEAKKKLNTAAEAVAVVGRGRHRAPIVATRHFAAARGATRLGAAAAPEPGSPLCSPTPGPTHPPPAVRAYPPRWPPAR